MSGASPAGPCAAPPPPVLLLLNIFMVVGVLDAVDLTVLGQCSRELRGAVAGVWKGVRAGNTATRLRSVERCVDDAAENKAGWKEYVPVSQAGDCVVCGELTRFRHPVEGSMLCAPCGRKGETWSDSSPLSHFAMIAEQNAKKLHGLASSFDLGKHLRFAVRKPWVPDPKTVWYVKYAPEFADDAKSALKEHQDQVARPPRTTALIFVGPSRVFLKRELICLLLEKYGGPKLLKERFRNRQLPPLDPAKPDA
jgi:hypothetical protein